MPKPILLDTHVWLWMNGAPDRLGAEATAMLTGAGYELVLSTASVWEIGIKAAVGKLSLPQGVDRWVRERLVTNRLAPLAVGVEHALRAAALPPIHRDPFDRMLVAQAQVEGLALMTGDAAVAGYEIDLIPAGR